MSRVQRAQIILMASDGTESQEIAQRMRVSRPTVQLWRQRFLALQVAGLEKDAPRPGRIPTISAQKISAVVEATLHTTPPHATTSAMVRPPCLQPSVCSTAKRSEIACRVIDIKNLSVSSRK